MLRLGLTGGIGSGKSTVAHMLASRDGVSLIDADDIARRCTEVGGSAITAIKEQFGTGFLTPDGAMDRNSMRAHVFSNPQERQRLESIVHPLVNQEIRLRASLAAGQCVVFDVPLLVESPRWRPQLDRVLVVDCSVNKQIERVMARNGWSRPQVEAIVRQQCTRAERLAAADWVLGNDGIDLATLGEVVQMLAQRLQL